MTVLLTSWGGECDPLGLSLVQGWLFQEWLGEQEQLPVDAKRISTSPVGCFGPQGAPGVRQTLICPFHGCL